MDALIPLGRAGRNSGVVLADTWMPTFCLVKSDEQSDSAREAGVSSGVGLAEAAILKST